MISKKAKGIYFVSGKYRVIICVNGFSHHLGNFETLVDAMMYHDAATIAYKQQYRIDRLNFPSLESILYRPHLCSIVKNKHDQKILGRIRSRSKSKTSDNSTDKMEEREHAAAESLLNMSTLHE